MWERIPQSSVMYRYDASMMSRRNWCLTCEETVPVRWSGRLEPVRSSPPGPGASAADGIDHAQQLVGSVK